MESLFKLYRYANILSVDVVIGAVICASFFLTLNGLSGDPLLLTVLGITVWIIYAVDHLFDVSNRQQAPRSVRHQFFLSNYQVLVAVVILAIATNSLLIWFLPSSVWKGGLMLGLLSFIYLLFQRWLGGWKEFIAGILYAAGIALPAFTLGDFSFQPKVILLIVQFLLVVWTNLLLFSWFDHSHDEANGYRSFVTAFGRRVTARIIVVLFAISLVLVTSLYLYCNCWASLILVSMECVMIIIVVFPKYFQVKDRYRLIGDAAFWLPIIYFIFE